MLYIVLQFRTLCKRLSLWALVCIDGNSFLVGPPHIRALDMYASKYSFEPLTIVALHYMPRVLHPL